MLCQISNSEGPQEGKGRQGRTSSADSDMDIAGLPSDILVEVTASVATRSATPLNDIVNLWRSCKVFRDATAARKVGRCMAVHREWRLHWWDKARFLSVLRRCAASGNPEASYILGLEELCNRRRKARGLRHLLHAMEHGHAAAAYMIGMITLHDSLRSPGRRRAGAETLGLLLLRPCIRWPQQDKAQDGLRPQRGRVCHAKADDASVEDDRASNTLLESVVRQGGDEDSGGLGRRRR